MSEIINLPTTNGQRTTAKLVDIDTEKSILIKSLPYVPDFQQDSALFKDAAQLLDALLQSKESIENEVAAIQAKYNEEGNGQEAVKVDWTVMDEIYTAYCDTLYKLPGYSNLSYAARIALIEENGFDYVLDLLLHMYDTEYAALEKKYKDGAISTIEPYEDFVKRKSNATLTRLTSLFTIINILKGTTPGLELVFRILDVPEFLYLTWDIISDYKGPITISDEDKFIPLPMESGLITDKTEPEWGNKYVTDNNIIWRRTKGESTNIWQPNMSVEYGDSIQVGEHIYEAFKPDKGDVFVVSGDSGNVQYIFNGVQWHPCTDYKDYETQREQFTAILTINGLQNSSDLQEKLDKFVRYYMLPYIDVALEFRASAPFVYAYPSGYGILEIALLFANYIDERGNWIHHNLSTQVNDRWGVSNETDVKDLTLGKPTYADKGFQGEIDLCKSFVQDPDGTRHPLYDKDYLTIPDAITGPARDKYNDKGEITNYDGDYLQVGLCDNSYADVDFDMKVHQNPHWEEDDQGEYSIFVRDTLIKIFKALTVYGVDHMSVAQLNRTKIKEFYEQIEEVYGGRTTSCVPTSVSVHCTTRTPWVRPQTGIEGPYNLLFSDYEMVPTKYTGIGDIGILGSNEYFIYNGMLMKADNDRYIYIDGHDDWTDVGASNVNPDYITPAIEGGMLKYIHNNEVHDLHRDNGTIGGYKTHCEIKSITVRGLEELEIDQLSLMTLNMLSEYVDMSYWSNIEYGGNWTHVTGFVNKNYTAYGICDGRLYKIYLKNDKAYYTMLDEDQTWTYITGAYYYDTYKAYGIKNGVMYRIGDDIEPLTCNGQVLTGWDGSFDCISRYHHSNDLFKTYGICNGNLYSINNTNVELLDSNGWTAICGYYNDESPRTFGYGIKNGALYEIRNDQIILKDNTMFWYDISGCSTTTKTFVLGLAKYYESEPSGYIYKIKDGTCEKLMEDGGWTDVFGRYTTSTSANANCFGYGVKNNKLYILHRDMADPVCVSGNWKLDGQGTPVDLLDYDITNIYVIINGQVISGQNEVVKYIPIDENDDPHNYDIIVNYETVGFNDNTRYNIRTEHTFSQDTYIDPEEAGEHHRTGISLAHMNGEFNTATGISNPFINCPVIIHGTRKINGAGEAYDFVNEQTYLELPNMGYYMVEFDYDGKHYGPYRFNMTDENVEFMVDNEFIYNIPQDDPVINSYITRILNQWDANLERDIHYLLTVRDEFSITVTTTQYPDSPNEIVLQCGCIGNTDNYKPIILDTEFNTGIYFGNQQIAVLDISGNYTKLYELPVDDYLMPYFKFIKSGNNFNVYKSLDGITYTNTNKQVKMPKYMGGDGTTFGDCIICLAPSYMVGNLERVNLYENGYYVSVDTQGGPVIEYLTTGENQELQKVIEIQTQNGITVLDLDMDTLYTSMEASTSNPDLQLTNNYTLNKLNRGFHEGIDTATLTYSGEYYLDEEKANEVGNIGNYQITRKASNFDDDNYLNINPEHIDPLVITTSDDVNEQYLFDSEEDSIVTNKYLLTTDLDGEYAGSNNNMRLVHSGAEYELLTDKPQTITKVLEYNAESFSIDYNKIYNIETIPYDSYRALLNFQGQEGSNVAATINIDLDGTILPDGSIDSLPVLNFSYPNKIKKKVFEFDKQDIQIGDTSLIEVPLLLWYQMGEEGLEPMEEDKPEYDENTDTYSYDGHVLTYTSDIFIDETEYHVYEYDDHSFYLHETTQIEELPDLDPAYTFNEDGNDLWWKLNIKKTFHGINEQWLIEHNPGTDPKDKLIYDEGKVHNFSDTNYFDLEEIKDSNGFVLCIKTGDDTSINQGIFDCKDVGSLCIKNDKFYWVGADGTEYISDYIPAPNKEYSFAIRNLKYEGYEDGVYYGDHDNYENRNSINVANIYITLDGLKWIPLFDSVTFRIDLTNTTKYSIGYSNVGVEYLPFLGIVDLTKSWVEQIENEKLTQARLFLITQVTKFYISPDNTNWTLYETITTPYSVWNYTMGYEYTGSLDMYDSQLLINYDLDWVDSGVYINTRVREDLAAAGIPVGDLDVFDIEAYGVQLSQTPERWDTVTVTYTTTDNAYYLQPNTKYYIKFKTKLDTESGKCLLEQDGNATWNNGIISGLSTTDNYNMSIDRDYVVIKFKPGNITTLQGICGYNVDNSKSIVLENKELKCFDDTTYHTLLTNIKTNKYYWIKLYSITKPIEISLDGETWEQTDVELAFSNYKPFVIGNGWTASGRKEFLGSIDMKGSYISKDDVVTYMYIPYKKVMPMISTNGTTYQKLALVPLLTTKNFITFGKGFDGELDLYESNLLKTDNVYWQAKQITVYKDSEVIDKLILDDLDVPTPYWTEEEFIRVNPEDLKVIVTGLPEIGDEVILTYNTWYLFREDNTTYNFNVEYDDTYCYISYNKLGDDKKYLLYTTYKRPYIINTGYQFNGRLSYYESTRHGLPFCAWYTWDTYEINYKEHGTDEWINWSMFTVNQNVTVFEQCGFDLNGTHYLETSWYKKRDYLTPFIAHYDINYVLPYGAVNIVDGIATVFDEDSYLKLIPEMLKDNMRVDIAIKTADISNQGIATNALINRGQIAYSTRVVDTYGEAKPNSEYVIQYLFVNGKLVTRVLYTDYVDFEPDRQVYHTITAIPVNVDAQEGDEDYYIKTQEQASKISALYRVMNVFDTWDKGTNTGAEAWYPIDLQHVEVVKYGQKLLYDLYVLQIPIGWRNGENTNPDGLDIRKGDVLQIRFITEGQEHQSYMEVLTYNDIKYLHKIKF